MSIIVRDQNDLLIDTEVTSKIIELEKLKADLKKAEDLLKEALLAEMELNNIVKIETQELRINYIASSDREDFDKKRFRQDHAELYDDYVKMIPVKASVRIKVK